MKLKSRQHHRGFTLIEVLVVITIILLLAGLSLGGLRFVKTKRDNNRAEIHINLISKAIEDYKLDNGDYPGDEDAGGGDGKGESNMLFQALYYDGFMAENPDAIYLSELDPNNDSQKWLEGTGASTKIIDPWKREYLYRRGSGAMNPDYDLWSMGEDGATSGNGTSPEDKDDIRNF
ncbi:MAG: type II secretion system protein GspG [Verrucomicrobiota bacterium]